MKNTINSLVALGLLTVIGCSVASTEDDELTRVAPERAAEPSLEDGAVHGAPDFDEALDVRRIEATARGRSVLEQSSIVEEALRRHHLDPMTARREARAIEESTDDSVRASLLTAFIDKYAFVMDELTTVLPAHHADLAEIADAVADRAELSTEGFATRAHSACTGTTSVAPYASSTPPPSGTIVNGNMFAFATGGFADGDTSKSTVRTWGINVSAADSTLHVNAKFALESGRVEVWSALFGYATAGVSLNLAVKSSDGRVLCTAERKLADFGVNTGHVNHTIPPATYNVGCTASRPRDASLGVFAEVTLGAWNGVGGAAGAHATVGGRLVSVSSRNCVEPGIFFDGAGLCVKPLSGMSNTPLRINACDADPNGKWTFDSAVGTIRHRATGMCLTPSLFATIRNGTSVVLRPCDGSPRQRWRRLSDGKLQNRAAASPHPGFCLDGYGFGGPGAPLQMWECLTPGGKNQKWFFQP